MNVVVHIEGRAAVPVRAVLLATVGNVTAQGLALELAKPDAERGLTAYRCNQGGPVPVRADAWDMQHEILTGIVRGFKREEPHSDDLEQVEQRDAAWRKSLELLPASVFVWLDELENWYGTNFYTPSSIWEEEHRVIGEDDDPEPQYQLRHPTDTLDLFPIAMADCEELIFQGFETYLGMSGAGPAQTNEAPTVVYDDDALQDALQPAPASRIYSEVFPDPVQNSESPAPVVVSSDGPEPLPAVANWKMQIQAEATALVLRLRKSGANPTRHSILDTMAQWCRDNDIKTDTKIYPSANYLRTHVLGGKHWDVPN